MNQEELLTLLAQKDNKAYHYLYQHYYIALKALANYYVKNDQIAEDLVQEVFISLLNHEKPFAQINEVKYYLYNILKNKCLNQLRKLKVENKYCEEMFRTESELESFWDKMVEENVYAILSEAIQTLPPKCRQVMLMTLEGLKISEIAANLQISSETVKEYKSNGKKKLLNILRDRDLTFLIQLFWL